jgi:hypothetical protein
LAQIKVDQQRGVLVEREKVNKQVFRLMRMVRDGMLNVPSKVAPEIAAMDEPFAIQKRLEAEFRQVLEDMATSAANLADEPDDE